MRDTCFICSRNSYDFEHHGKVIPSFIHTFGLSLTDSGLGSVSPAWKSNYKRALMLTILLSIHLDIMFFSSSRDLITMFDLNTTCGRIFSFLFTFTEPRSTITQRQKCLSINWYVVHKRHFLKYSDFIPMLHLNILIF